MVHYVFQAVEWKVRLFFFFRGLFVIGLTPPLTTLAKRANVAGPRFRRPQRKTKERQQVVVEKEVAGKEWQGTMVKHNLIFTPPFEKMFLTFSKHLKLGNCFKYFLVSPRFWGK